MPGDVFPDDAVSTRVNVEQPISPAAGEFLGAATTVVHAPDEFIAIELVNPQACLTGPISFGIDGVHVPRLAVAAHGDRAGPEAAAASASAANLATNDMVAIDRQLDLPFTFYGAAPQRGT